MITCPRCGRDNQPGAKACSSCGHSFAEGLTTGSVVAGRYEILSLLGQGGMGAVYKAHDRTLDEMVAVKVLRSDLAGSAEVARRFRSEIKLARKVRHPNVCALHEYGEEGRLRFVVMELVEGSDLKHFVRDGGRLEIEDAFEIGIQVAEALQAIHGMGIIHRDLKTANIMRDQHGVVRLMDFGIAKLAEPPPGAAEATAVGHIIGTPEYMSPEQARGEKIDFRSDIYALGIVVYELFTGRVPFHGDTPMATILKQIQQPPPLEGPEAKAIPEAVLPVLARALAKDPAQRFPDPRQFAEALRRVRVEVRVLAGGTLPPAVLTATAPVLPDRQQTVVTARTPVMVQAPSTVDLAIPATRGSATATIGARPRAAQTAGASAPATHRTSAPSTRRWAWAGGVAAAVVSAVVVGRLLVDGDAPRESPGPDASAVPQASPNAAGGAVSGDATSSPGLTEASAPLPSPSVAMPLPSVAMPLPSAAIPLPSPMRSPATAPSVQPSRPPIPSPAPRPSPLVVGVPPKLPSPAPVEPAPSRAPSLPPPAPRTGLLQFRVKPWAEVTVDGVARGTTPPLLPLALDEGQHVVRLEHPDFRPLQRRVKVVAGETVRVDVDWQWDGVRR